MSAQLDSVTTYRLMREADLDAIFAIERRVHAHPWTRGNFADSLAAGYQCWVAERDSRLIAYGIITVAAEEAHLLNLSVESSWQRRGIGTELARFFVRIACDQGAARIFLEVRPSNLAARALYGRIGFAEVGARPGYYPAVGGREDAVVMELRLK